MDTKIKRINSTMQNGYIYYQKNKTDACLKNWLETWNLIKDVISENNILSIDSFDKTYDLTQYLCNWVMDFQEVLQNFSDYELHNNFCEWLIPLFGKYDLNLKVIKMSIAETYFNMGNMVSGESSFKVLTSENPEYGWGWINWSRQYWLFVHTDTDKDYKKGEEILLEALKVKKIEDREDIYVALLDLYEESAQEEQAKTVEKKLKTIRPERKKQNYNILSGENALKEGNFQENIPYGFGMSDPMTQSANNGKKIGRNEPCPCGSGKKYKKCCG